MVEKKNEKGIGSDETSLSRSWDPTRLRKSHQEKKHVRTHTDVELHNNIPKDKKVKKASSLDIIVSGLSILAKRGSTFQQIPREIDFKQTRKIFFTKKGKETTELNKDIEIKDYFPAVFRNIRSSFKITESRYLNTLSSSEKLFDLGGLGKSGSMIYYTADIFLVIKSIRKIEKNLLVTKIRQIYFHSTTNPQTNITLPIGLFRILSENKKKYFIITKNIFYPCNISCRNCSAITSIYDIKGATLHREEDDPNLLKKDKNWLNDDTRIKLIDYNVIKQLEKDLNFLSSIGSMDYSLLIGIAVCNDSKCNTKAETLPSSIMMSKDDSGTKRLFYLGVIDVLTKYRLVKALEGLLKSICYQRSEISAVSPKVYSKRLLKFLKEYVFV